MNCPACNHANPADARFCQQCGTRLALVCSACGQALPPDARYCSACGTPVGAAAAPPAAPVAPAAPQPPPLPTAFANGRYSVKRFLGEGGKKKVYLVHDTLLDRDVAFSLIKTEGLDEVGVERIKREAQLMGRLGDHPYVVSLYDIGDEAGQPFLVSQLMQGGDVEGLIEKAPEHRPPLETTLRIVDQICQALEYAHSHGIIHRDLKPGNVWLTRDGTAKLGDFGLAMSIDKTRLSIAGMIVGTVGYMPPEQALGRTADARADLYSLGAMLYEMVTGRPPFLGDDPVSIISQHVNTAPVAPSWHNRDVPKPLESLILRLLEKDPNARPESAAAVRRELATITPPAPSAPRDGNGRTPSQEANPLDQLAAGVFVGREKELNELRAAFDGALSGRGGVVLLAGEPGIGKTRLAEELGTYATLRGAQVLWGRSYEWEGAPAYWPWVQMIRDYVHAHDALELRTEMGAGASDIGQIVSEVREKLPGLPPAPTGEGEQVRFRLFDSIATFLRNASDRQPLVLVFDDLHWADKPSLLLLQFVARELRGARLLLLGTYRDVEVGRHHPLGQTLAELTREPRTRRIVLHGLDQGDVERYVTLATGTQGATRLVDAIYQETEGNPFFVTEVVRLLASEGRFESSRGESDSVSLPQGVREVVGRRLDRLSEECNQALTVASVIGRSFTLQMLERVTDFSSDQLLDLLEEAVRAKVIREDDTVGRYHFSQELVQETLYEELSPGRRVRLHARIGCELEQLHPAAPGPHAAELAHHFWQAAPAGEVDRAIIWATRAGERAMSQLAYEEAADQYQRALQALDMRDHPDEGQRCDLLLALGEAQRAAETPAARESFSKAAHIARTRRAPESLARAALGLAGSSILSGGQDELVIALLSEAIDALGPGDTYLRASCLARLALEQSYSAEPGEVDRLATTAVDAARRLEDPAVLSLALHAKHLALYGHARLREGLDIAAEAEEAAKASGRLDLLLTMLCWRMFEPLHLGDIERVDLQIASITQLNDQLRQPTYSFVVTGIRAMRAIMSGEFDRAAALAEEQRVLGQRVSASFGDFWWWLLSMHLRRERGDMRSLENEAKRLIAKFERIGQLSFMRSTQADLAIILAEQGRVAEVGDILDSVMSAHAQPLVFEADDPNEMYVIAHAAEASAVVGDKRYATRLREILRPYATHNVTCGGTFMFAGPVAHYLGMLSTVLEEWETANEDFEAAITMHQRMRTTPFLARTQYEYANMLAKSGRPGDEAHALALVDQALATAESLGMTRLSEQALALKVRIQGILKA